MVFVHTFIVKLEDRSFFNLTLQKGQKLSKFRSQMNQKYVKTKGIRIKRRKIFFCYKLFYIGRKILQIVIINDQKVSKNQRDSNKM